MPQDGLPEVRNVSGYSRKPVDNRIADALIIHHPDIISKRIRWQVPPVGNKIHDARICTVANEIGVWIDHYLFHQQRVIFNNKVMVRHRNPVKQYQAGLLGNWNSPEVIFQDNVQFPAIGGPVEAHLTDVFHEQFFHKRESGIVVQVVYNGISKEMSVIGYGKDREQGICVRGSEDLHCHTSLKDPVLQGVTERKSRNVRILDSCKRRDNLKMGVTGSGSCVKYKICLAVNVLLAASISCGVPTSLARMISPSKSMVLLSSKTRPALAPAAKDTGFTLRGEGMPSSLKTERLRVTAVAELLVIITGPSVSRLMPPAAGRTLPSSSRRYSSGERISTPEEARAVVKGLIIEMVRAPSRKL